MSDLAPLMDAFNNVISETGKLYIGEIESLRTKLADAMKFVPHPETMSGYCDPSAPDDVKELIALAAKLRGRTLPEPESAIIGRPDKPFHKPECHCADCESWRANNPNSTEA